MSNLEFGATYDARTLEYVSNCYAPSVYNDPDGDVIIDGGSEWRAIVGKTGQYGYRGAVMHPSETADDATIARWVDEAGGTVFAIVEVVDCEDESALVGWAIVYR